METPLRLCPTCGSLLTIGSDSKRIYENDNTPDKPTISYKNRTIVCVNENCPMFCGKDAKGKTKTLNPDQIVQVFRVEEDISELKAL